MRSARNSDSEKISACQDESRTIRDLEAASTQAIGVPMKFLLALIIALTGSVSLFEAQATTRPDPAEIDAGIRCLIDVVASSEYAFLRNSRRYSGVQAAQHLQRKYAHFREQIHTVDDFITLAASRSLLTGKPYRVVDAAGAITPTSRWLQQVRSDCCAGHATGPASPASDQPRVPCTD